MKHVFTIQKHASLNLQSLNTDYKREGFSIGYEHGREMDLKAADIRFNENKQSEKERRIYTEVQDFRVELFKKYPIMKKNVLREFCALEYAYQERTIQEELQDIKERSIPRERKQSKTPSSSRTISRERKQSKTRSPSVGRSFARSLSREKSPLRLPSREKLPKVKPKKAKAKTKPSKNLVSFTNQSMASESVFPTAGVWGPYPH